MEELELLMDVTANHGLIPCSSDFFGAASVDPRGADIPGMGVG